MENLTTLKMQIINIHLCLKFTEWKIQDRLKAVISGDLQKRHLSAVQVEGKDYRQADIKVAGTLGRIITSSYLQVNIAAT